MGVSEIFKKRVLQTTSSKTNPTRTKFGNHHVVFEDFISKFPENDANNKNLFPVKNGIVKHMKKGFESQ